MVLFIDPGETVELILIIYGFCLSPFLFLINFAILLRVFKMYLLSNDLSFKLGVGTVIKQISVFSNA